MARATPPSEKDRLVTVTLDPNTITSIDPDEVHEWRIAIYDLVETNSFAPARVKSTGPYALHVSIVGNWIVHGSPPERPAIFDEARCQRARLDARKGNADPQLIEECHRRGLLPDFTIPTHPD